jgi:hypothetical protein
MGTKSGTGQPLTLAAAPKTIKYQYKMAMEAKKATLVQFVALPLFSLLLGLLSLLLLALAIVRGISRGDMDWQFLSRAKP